jgi:PAS domain S-box-containing protein
MERLGMFNAVNIPRVNEMPAAAVNERKLLESLDVKSAIIMPLKYRGVLIGLLGFSAVRKERWWSEGEIMLMRIAGDMITGALMRKAADLELTDSDELFRMLTEGIQTLVLVYAHGRFIYANRAAARFTGYDTDELPGMSFWEVVHPEMREEVRRRGLARENGQREPAEYRMKFLCKDRSVRWAYVYVSTASYKDEKAILISGIDITGVQAGFP